jgi:hypothetical protein
VAGTLERGSISPGLRGPRPPLRGTLLRREKGVTDTLSSVIACQLLAGGEGMITTDSPDRSR